MPVEVTEKIKSDTREVVSYLEKDPIRYAQEIQNLISEQEMVELYICRRGGKIAGHISIYRSPEATFVGISAEDERIVLKLLEFLPSNKMVITVEPGFSDFVKRRVFPTSVYMNHLMVVAKGEERIVDPNPAFLLSTDYAEEYARFPTWPIPVDWARERLAKDRVFGIIADGKLVSVAAVTTKIPQTGNIAGVETLENYRRRGYATQVVSAAVENALIHSDAASLIVRKDNLGAFAIYEKLNFVSIGEVAWLDLGTGLMP